MVWVFSLIAAHPIAATLVGVLAVGTAVVVVIVRAKRRDGRQAIQQTRTHHISAYHQMSPGQFEHALAQLCVRDGCRDVRVVGGSGDLGADVIATTPAGYRLVIQAKRYAPTTKVGSGDVQKVGGTARQIHGAQLVAVVTTSVFTRPALAYMQQLQIRPVDADGLAGWVSRTGPAPWH